VEGVDIFNVVCAYAPQIGLEEDIKMLLWEALDEIAQNISQIEKLFVGVILMGI